jgi:putative membrane protein
MHQTVYRFRSNRLRFGFSLELLAAWCLPLLGSGVGNMIRAIVVGVALSVATASWAQSSSQSPAKPQKHEASSATAAKADQAFVTKAAGANMAEVELGKLAVERASRDEVKRFGQQMIDDHTKAGDELKTIAQQKQLDWPTALDAKHKALKDKLSKLSGENFDRTYMQEMVNGHRTVASELRMESQSGKDPEVKAWASKTLPTVEEHLKQAQDVNKQVASKYSTKR